jgi:hypothetical protein
MTIIHGECGHGSRVLKLPEGREHETVQRMLGACTQCFPVTDDQKDFAKQLGLRPPVLKGKRNEQT